MLTLNGLANAHGMNSIDDNISLQQVMNLMSRKDHLTNADQANNYRKTCPGCGRRYFTFCTNSECPLKKKNK